MKNSRENNLPSKRIGWLSSMLRLYKHKMEKEGTTTPSVNISSAYNYDHDIHDDEKTPDSTQELKINGSPRSVLNPCVHNIHEDESTEIRCIPNILDGAAELSLSWFRITDDVSTERMVQSAVRSSLETEQFDVWDNMNISWQDYFISKLASFEYFEKIKTVAMRHTQEKKYYKALKAFEVAKTAYSEKKQLADTIHNIGVVNMRAGRFDPKIFQRATIARKDALGGVDHPLVIASLVEMGISLFFCRRFTDALEVFQETLRIGTIVSGTNVFFVSKAMNNIGCTEFALGNNDGALQAFQESLEHLRPKFTAIDNKSKDEDLEILLRCADTLINMGFILAHTSNKVEARDVLEDAYLVQRTILGEDDCNTLFTSEKISLIDEFLEREKDK